MNKSHEQKLLDLLENSTLYDIRFIGCVTPDKDFSELMIFTSVGQLWIKAETECCESTYFVGSDTEWPDGLKYNVKMLGQNWNNVCDVINIELRDSDPGVVAFIAINTTKGQVHLRMTTDGGESGCYSGQFSVKFRSSKDTGWFKSEGFI